MIKIWFNLLLAFTKLGILGYGGGPSMIPLIQVETVNAQNWMSEEEFIDTLAMGNALPGPIATKMSFFIGYKVGGWPGAFIALFGLLWPSTVLMMVLGLFFLKFKDMPYARAMLTALRPVVLGLLVWTAYEVIPSSVKNWHTGLIAVLSFVIVTFLHVHPAWVILAAAALGLLVYR